MNIKSERAHALAREAARRSGLSQTSVVEQALRRYLQDLPAPDTGQSRAERVRALVADFHEALTEEDRAAMSLAADALYDDRGLFG